MYHLRDVDLVPRSAPRRNERIEQVADAIDQRFARTEVQAAEFFQEERAGRIRIEKLLILLAQKGGATEEELAPLATATQALKASREELQEAVHRAQPEEK